jgi:hypothetical protein
MTRSINNFPDDFIDPSKKDAQWGLKVAKAIWSQYLDEKTVIGQSRKAQIRTLRAYSAGRQPITPYIAEAFNLKEGGVNEFLRKAKHKVDYSIVSIAPKLKELMLGLLEEIDHEIDAESIDPVSRDKKQVKKYREYLKSKMMPLMEKMEKNNGVPADRPKFQIEDYVDIEMYEMVGGFKLGHEIALEELAKSIHQFSDWKSIARKLRSDLWDIGCTFMKEYFDPFTGRVKEKWIDIEKSVIGYVDEASGKIPYAGHCEELTLGEIESIMYDEGYHPDYIKKHIKTLIKSHSNYKSHADINYWMRHKENENRPNYWGLTVETFCFEYITVDRKYKTSRKNGENTYLYHEDTFGKTKNNEKRMTKIVDSQMLYTGRWVIDTEILLEWGKASYIVRPTKDTVQCSYHYIEIPGASKVERITGFLDSLQISHLKLQSAKAAAAPKGLAIDINSLNNISLGDGVVKPIEVIRIYRQLGSLPYRSYTIHNKIANANNTPIKELAGGIGPQLDEWSKCWADDMARIFEATGFTDVAAASPDQSGEMTLGSAQIAMQQTNNSFKMIYESVTSMKEKVTQAAVKRAITAIALDPETKKRYYNIIGENSVQALISVKDVSIDDLGIKMVATPDQHQKNRMYRAAEEALKVGKNGQPLIEYIDYTMISRMIDQGKIKQSESFLAYRTEKKLKELEEKQKQNIILQKEEERKTEQAKSLLKLQEIDAEKQKELMMIQAKGEEDRKTEEVKHQSIMRQLEKEGSIEVQKGTEISGRV